MKKKRIVSLLLSMIVCIAMMPVAVFADETEEGTVGKPVGVWTDYATESFAGGSGTEVEPYQIETAGQLAKLAADVNSGVKGKTHDNEYFILTKNIDLSAHRWVPIGSGSQKGSFHAFSGYFNGNGNNITGLYVDESNEKNSAGFFGNVSGYTIEKLTIEDAYVKSEAMTNPENQIVDAVGILIGNASEGYGMSTTIKNCNVSGTVETNKAISGGLVGYNSYGSYENCTADVTVIGGGRTGGFVGEDFKGKYTNCTAKGNASGQWSVGGFAGVLSFGTTVEKCASYGNIEANDWNVGGFAGYIESNVKVNNCVSFGNVTSTVNGWEPKTGGFAGTITKGESENIDCTITNSHAAGLITKASETHVAGGFAGVNDSSKYENCSFDTEKNSALKAIGGEAEGSEIEGVTGESTQIVRSNICKDYENKHTLVKVEAKEATTAEVGNKEHWKCENCGTLYSDEAGNNAVSEEEITIPKKSSGGGYYKPVQKPEISAGEGGNAALENNGTTLVITPDEGMQVSKVTVNGNEVTVTDNKVTGLKTGDKVEVTFAKTPPTKEELDKDFKEKAGEIELVVRTSKTSKNNIKVTVKLTPALEAFIKEIKSAGYTVKYKFYRSANKSSKYAARITKEEAEYLNTEGKKDKKYYYKAKLLIYDNEGNLVAQTELKQCKYGLRTWSK